MSVSVFMFHGYHEPTLLNNGAKQSLLKSLTGKTWYWINVEKDGSSPVSQGYHPKGKGMKRGQGFTQEEQE